MTKRNRKSAPFFYRRDTSGVDEVFDIVSHETGNVIASFPFWEQSKRAKADARLVVAALNKLHRVGPNIRFPHFIEAYGNLAIVWSTDDVVFLRPDLSHEQAWKVLQRCQRVHEDNLGFTSNLIEVVADHMFPMPVAGGHNAVER